MSELLQADWKDISTEEWRQYTFAGGNQITVNKPVKLAVKAPPPDSVGGGSHRIIDGDGNGHYITSGWLKIYWKNKPGSPAVVL